MSPPVRWLQVKKTVSERAFFAFVKERLAILERRRAGRPAPWTKDPLLQRFHFTNINRRDDYGTRYYLEKIANRCLSTSNLVFNTIAYRLFNRVETFEAHGLLSAKSYSPWQVFKPVRALRLAGASVFTKAFQVCPMFEGIKTGDTIRNYALLLEELAAFSLERARELLEQPTLREAIAMLEEQKGMGSFIAPQIIFDLSYSSRASFDETQPIDVARGGSRWALSDLYGYEEPEKHQERFERLVKRSGLTFIECENALCEFSKYVRLTDKRSKSRRQFVPREW